MKKTHQLLAMAAMSALTIAASPVQADEAPMYGPGMMWGAGPGPGYGPGMMGGNGPGAYGPGGGYGPGHMWGYGGMGPGMMGGGGYGGMGPGMMGGWGYGGMGPGMMGGSGYGGMGPGMMGGWGYGGMGPGMMGWSGGGLYALDLSDQQRSKLDQIQGDLHKKNWAVMGRMLEEQTRLRELLDADKPDPAAVGKASMKIADLRRQMLESAIEARNGMDALLTPEQKAQLKKFRRPW